MRMRYWMKAAHCNSPPFSKSRRSIDSALWCKYLSNRYLTVPILSRWRNSIYVYVNNTNLRTTYCVTSLPRPQIIEHFFTYLRQIFRINIARKIRVILAHFLLILRTDVHGQFIQKLIKTLVKRHCTCGGFSYDINVSACPFTAPWNFDRAYLELVDFFILKCLCLHWI